MCFVHVLLNALDLKKQGHEVAVVIEGSATYLTKLLSNGEGAQELRNKAPAMIDMITDLFHNVKEAGLITCVCRACSKQMGALEDAQRAGLPLCDELQGHPSMATYVSQGYEVISF